MFNPFEYRGDSRVFRGLEFAFRHRRLDFRMHNKLLVVDNASALIGGRNVGDEYFQVNPQQQYADDDVFVVGPTVPAAFQPNSTCTGTVRWPFRWRLSLAADPTEAELAAYRAELSTVPPQAPDNRTSYLEQAATGQPLQGILDGELPLVWAAAQVVCDPPDKQHPHKDATTGPFNYEALATIVAGRIL